MVSEPYLVVHESPQHIVLPERPLYVLVLSLHKLKYLQRPSASVPSRLDMSEMRDNARRLREMLLVGRRRRQRRLCKTRGWRDALVLHYVQFSHSCMHREVG